MNVQICFLTKTRLMYVLVFIINYIPIIDENID
jgi:hypothetical protein